MSILGKEVKPFIKFRAEDDGKQIFFNVTTEELRRVLKKSKPESEQVTFACVIGKKKYVTTVPVKDLRANIRKIDYSIDIIPKKLSASGFITDVTLKIKKVKKRNVVGREAEIDRIWSCLSRDSGKSNAVMIGDVGAGRTTIAMQIAKQIASNQCPREFTGKRFIMISFDKIVKIESDFVYKHYMDLVVDFISENKKNCVFYIDNLLSAKYEIETIELLNSMFASKDLKLLAGVSYEDYEKYFEPDISVMQYLNSVEIREPEIDEIYPMIEGNIENMKKQYGINISKEIVDFAIYTEYLSDSVLAKPGNILSTIKWAFSEAQRNGKSEVDKESVIACYDIDRKMIKIIDPKELKEVAYHELGHYIALKKNKELKDLLPTAVSILPQMSFLGVTMMYSKLGKRLMWTRDYCIEYIMVDLAGRVSENLISKDYSTGASSDLQSANALAEQMIMSCGLSKKTERNRTYAISSYFIKDYLLTDKKKDEINDEIEDIIDTATEKIETKINENEKLIELLSLELIDKKIMTDDEITKFAKEHGFDL